MWTMRPSTRWTRSWPAGIGSDFPFPTSWASTSAARSSRWEAKVGEQVFGNTGAGGCFAESLVITGDTKERPSPLPAPPAEWSKHGDHGLRQAVEWHKEEKVKPVVTQIVPFDPHQLQEAFDAFLEGSNNVGEIVVQCDRQE